MCEKSSSLTFKNLATCAMTVAADLCVYTNQSFVMVCLLPGLLMFHR